jgi:hypothetical protein
MTESIVVQSPASGTAVQLFLLFHGGDVMAGVVPFAGHGITQPMLRVLLQRPRAPHVNQA